uniref:DUF4005 domain-containing protein n=1 Tax=Musa acuminata subsp. malaccensis TaxID=214687 RepID=A0A804K5J9_MUSAM
MGRAARWLRGLLAGKKADRGERPAEHKEKRRWGFQNKRAIAVAAATAAVAEAAVAAAQAAAVVVRLTSSGRPVTGLVCGKREKWAAVKIQSAFRGYLARRALRALRGLVKLQALVRGNIVRKQAAETLRCMQALVRVQARARACRALRSERSRPEKAPRPQAGPPTPEKYEPSVRTNATDRSCMLKRNSSKPAGRDAVDCDRADMAAWNWLDRWMEERNAKILEVDPGKPQFRQKRSSHHQHSCSSLTSEHNSRGFTAAAPDSPSKDSTTLHHSVPSPSSCSRSLFNGYADYPNYMANTESSKAKARSQSAPKQRPESEKPGSLKRSSAQSSSSLRAKFSSKAYPGSGRLDRLGMPLRI